MTDRDCHCGERGTAALPILMYHDIAADAEPAIREFVVSPERFHRQMAFLAAAGFQPLPISRLAESIARGHELPARAIAITFDDGFAGVYRHALPILQHFGFVATLYVSTGYVSSTARWLRKERATTRPMASWSQLRTLSGAGIECGGHSHSHPMLDLLPRPLARREITYCRSLLQEELSAPIASFAYPYGSFDNAVRAMVVEAGYDSACAVRYDFSSLADDRFGLARLMVTDTISQDDFERMLVTHDLPFDQKWRRDRARLWRHVRRVVAAPKRRYPRSDVA